MTDESGDATRRRAFTELMQIAVIISVPVMFEHGIVPYKEAVVALLMLVAILLVIE